MKYQIKSQLMKNSTYRMKKLPAIKIEQHQLTYIPIPKVACTSLHALCVDLLGFELPSGSWKAGVFRGDKFDQYIDTNLRDSAKISTYQAAQLDHWCFAVTRNPYDRLVSCYSEKICNEIHQKNFVNGLSNHFVHFGTFYAHMPFSEFVDAVCNIDDHQADAHFRSQHCFITNQQGKLIPDFLCDFSELNQLNDKIKQQTGVVCNIPHLLKSKREGWHSYYTEQLKVKVAKRYQRDFELLGYQK